NEYDLKRVKDRATHDHQIPAIEVTDPLAGNREEIEARKGGEYSSPGPRTNFPAPYYRQEDGNKHHANPRNEGGLGRSCPGDPGGLKRVSSEHDRPNLQSGPKLAARKFPEIRAVNPRHGQSAQRKSRRQVGEHRDIGQRVLYHDESHTPKQRRDHHGAVCFEPEAHGMRFAGQAGAGSTFTLNASSEAWSPPESGAGSTCLP